jgi:hypothetical protein
MKQQIITIIEKEGFLEDMDNSSINFGWHSLEDKYYFQIKYKEESISTETVSKFLDDYNLLLEKYNFLLVMSDSDIVNFKNNLITLINNYFN